MCTLEWYPFPKLGTPGGYTKGMQAFKIGSFIKRGTRMDKDRSIKLNEEGFELYEKIVQLKLASSDGKRYETDCADTELILMIIQSIPSPKAEPFKVWLAKVGNERINETQNPDFAILTNEITKA